MGIPEIPTIPISRYFWLVQPSCKIIFVILQQRTKNYMKLSELKTGEHGIIVKVSGHGGFRKRIIEMGFIKGKEVQVLLNAPLQDPVKYRIMGYEVSLRHSEADQIEVVTHEEAPLMDKESQQVIIPTDEIQHEKAEKTVHREALKRRREINVALVGNPNCGKTSLFNFASGAHERVGNYSGVTVDAKEGVAEYLERNLYLTTQLIDMNLRMVGALNMFDESEQRGDLLNTDKLGELLGFPMVPTVFKSGKGVDELFTTIIQVYEGKFTKHPIRHIHINHGHEIENGIKDMQEHLKQYGELRRQFSTRYLAIKLLEHDSEVEKIIATLPDQEEILQHRDDTGKRIEEETKTDSETAIMDAKYGFIHGALEEIGYKEGKGRDTYYMTHKLDRFITHKWLGFPLFFLFLFIMLAEFHLTRRSVACDDCRWSRGRCGLGNHLPAADSHSLHVHLLYGGLRLYVASSLHHGQADAQDGYSREIVHPPHYGLRL